MGRRRRSLGKETRHAIDFPHWFLCRGGDAFLFGSGLRRSTSGEPHGGRGHDPQPHGSPARGRRSARRSAAGPRRPSRRHAHAASVGRGDGSALSSSVHRPLARRQREMAAGRRAGGSPAGWRAATSPAAGKAGSGAEASGHGSQDSRRPHRGYGGGEISVPTRGFRLARGSLGGPGCGRPGGDAGHGPAGPVRMRSRAPGARATDRGELAARRGGRAAREVCRESGRRRQDRGRKRQRLARRHQAQRLARSPLVGPA